MTRKQHHKITNKAKTVSNKVSLQTLRDSRKRGVWTAVLTILSLIIVHATLIFHTEDATPLDAYLSSQASAGCFYTNMLALLSTAYGKATASFHVSGHTFLLSMVGYVLVAHIFAQAVFMVYSNVRLYAEFMRSEWFALIGHITLFGIIFAINLSRGIPNYTKETIKK